MGRTYRLSLPAGCVAATLAYAGGCTFGPKHLESGHTAYNEALRATGDDELILNIVRLRYLDSIEFMATTSITSQLEFEVAVGAEGGSAPDFLGGSFGVGRGAARYSTRPTFSFTPMRGGEFAERLVEPVDVDILAYLIAADWDINVLFRLLVRATNGLENELGITEPAFKETAARLGSLQANAKLFVGFIPEVESLSDPIDASRVTGTDLVEAARSGFQFRKDGEDAFVLTSTRPKPVLAIKTGSPGAEEVIEALGLKNDGRPFYEIEEGTQLGPRPAEVETLSLRTRSLMQALVYLAQAVDVPEEHIEDGIIPRTWIPGLESQVDINDIFTIHTAPKRPHAEIEVQHRGHWFYIDDRDVPSRLTFLHAAELFRLGLARDTKAQDAPVLTLPVGG